MFETAEAFGSFAVDDLAAAQKFYGETLGLRVSEEGGALMLFLADDHRILVYPSSTTARRRSQFSTSPLTISTRLLTS
jgi:catechol 2,3-dioxygenase-like lactoylglutathione lyase family enzyme